MIAKIYLTKQEITTISQKAELLSNIENDTYIEISIDDDRIVVDVPNAVRSTQKEPLKKEEVDIFELGGAGKD